MTSHLRIQGAPPARWDSSPPLLPVIDGHRHPNGPYTVAAALLHHLVPRALERSHDLVAAHDIEIRAAAPGLAGLVPARRVAVDSALPDDERILVPAPRRTLRLANGLAEFVAAAVPPGSVVVVCNAAEADPTDTELLEVLARRIPPGVLRLVVYSAGPAPPPDTRTAARLWEQVDRCVREGFLYAVVELGERGLTLTEPGGELWWRFAQRAATALGGLGRRAEARALWERVRGHSQDPAVHAACAYGIAMLDARDPDPARRDLGRARAWLNQAVAISRLLPDPVERAFKLGFDRNALALVEWRQGRSQAALALVESALELADKELSGRHPQHRMVLLANRARLLAATGRAEEALADYTAAIAVDPAFPDNYLERGNLLLALRRHDEALADYESAITAGPPLPEAYYNRAELRTTLGDLDAALADLGHVIELDPAYLDAYINRAGLLAGLERDAEAAADVEAGLALAPGNPHLLSVLGQLETAAGRFAEAESAFGAAIAAAPGLAAAWANRGVMRYAAGDLTGALADLDRAIDLEPHPDLHLNRATALRELGRTAEAAAAEREAARLTP
ncbi:tetratricopeptide repeat protein [Nonomuraea sp. NPDC046570]|uniref:tetratricopeptide repeat protein n=1 Tax=Nonomuraea sp. NPDC046570 TaxID=3155255 RepID=UPI0033CDADD2